MIRHVLLCLLSVSAGHVWSQPIVALPADTLPAQVREWSKEKIYTEKYGGSRRVLKGATHDLSLLDIRAITLRPSVSTPYPAHQRLPTNSSS